MSRIDPIAEGLIGDGSIGPTVATRPMFWRRADGVDVPALVEIGMPFESPNPPGPWRCRVRTTGLGDDRYYTMFAEDSVGALVSALTLAGVLVSQSPFATVSNWAHIPNYGFPRPLVTLDDIGEGGGDGGTGGEEGDGGVGGGELEPIVP